MAFSQLFPGSTIATKTSMFYRMLDANGDYTMGYGPSNWWGFQPEGVAQAAYTRMQLNQGDWFLDVTDGMPWTTKVLGKSTQATRDLVAKARLLGTPYLTSIISYNSSLSSKRAFLFTTSVLTAFSANAQTVTNMGAI